MITLKNILQHEFIGLRCDVIKSKNKSQIGATGLIVDETMKTIVIDNGMAMKRIQKSGTIFRISLDDKQIEVDGNFILSRPEDRIKRKIKKW
jgi:ribonuclease P protein subunit POP4